MPFKPKLRVSLEMRDLIRHMHPELKKKVHMAFSEIIENPLVGKLLLGELKGMRSFRVSKFRIIYRHLSDIIEVIAIGPRRRVYEETLRIIKKEERK